VNKEKTIGILYKYDPNWMGGTIYVFNLLKALELAQNKGYDLPKIIIFVDRYTKSKLDFSFSGLTFTLEYYNSPKWIKLINKISIKTIGYGIISWKHRDKLDALFPVNRPWAYFSNTPFENQIYWIPDFQCFHLPEYFEIEDIEARKKSYLETLTNAKKIVLSSESVFKDLKRFYPNRKYPQIGVLRFAVFNELKGDRLESIEFDRPYFICPNQFWAHKNQELILRALKFMGEVNLPFYVVFTGKMFDSRKNNHFVEIIEPLLEDKFVKHNIKLLGFIDRDVQLNLIKRAIALIQPSRFEGWSTVIEDGMSMGLNVLASKLEVNIEQLGNKGQYFDVDDYIGLAKMIQEFDIISIQKTNYLYTEKQLKFASDFLAILDS
jgi:glycosyltransferase involved in cell wall biosynthesis